MAESSTIHTVLADGTSVVVRAVGSADRDALRLLVSTIEPELVPAAFAKLGLGEESSIGLDSHDRQILVARLAGAPARLIGAALSDLQSDNPTQASFSVIVDPAHRGLGLATTLVRSLARVAHGTGVRSLEGDVAQENAAMLGVLTDVGLRVQQSDSEHSVHATFDLEPTEAYLAAIDRDEKAAACDALALFLDPERVAVVGASRNPLAIGGVVFANLIAGGFTGVVYPVNPSAHYVQGVAAYDSLQACPEIPDLVVICVPAAVVPSVIEEAVALGIRAVCIISAGFAEVGGAGVSAQAELLATAQAAGMRIVGPNCMGLLNGDADVRMNATFSRTFPKPGRLSFVSQSGALGLSVLDHLERLGIGISGFVSVGNKSDISGNDLLLYWEDDPKTDAILLYLESFGNPRRFSRIARRISRSKPIIAVKAGRTTAGRRAASSHTAALAAGENAVDALFHQAGVIRTDTLEEMFAVATLVTTQPAPAGNRVAIMTNGGGPGILAADACESHGLSVVELSSASQKALKNILPPNAGISNPVDMIASSTAEDYAATLEVLANAAEVDAVITIFIPPIVTDANEVALALADALQRVPDTKPLIGVFMGDDSADPALARAGIPSFDFPEDAARALSALTRWSMWRTRPVGHVVHPEGIDPGRARKVVDRALANVGSSGEQVWLPASEAAELLMAFGIPLIRSSIVASPEEAASAFDSLGVKTAVVKIASAIHKKDVGGVRLGITSSREAAAAVTDIRELLIAADLTDHAQEFIVQEMVGDGVEMMVGVTHDLLFGPLVVVGCGGSLVELIQDVNTRITPLTDVDVDEMLTTLRTYPLLTGFRGSEPLDIAAIKDLLFRVNSLVEAVPELAELDLNPVFAQSQGAVAVDLRVAVRAKADRLKT